jgi:hypothetical protein
MPLNPSNNYATPYHEYSVMYRKERMIHIYLISMDLRSLQVFHLADLLNQWHLERLQALTFWRDIF